MVKGRFSIFKRLTGPQILVLGLAFTIFVGAFLLSLPIAAEPNKHISFLDALFTAASAVCVTGLVVVDIATTFSYFGEVVILLLIQIGGLGFMTFTTLIAVLLGRKIGISERLALTESLNLSTMEGIVRLAKAIFLITIIIEALGILILSSRFIPEWGLSKGIYYAVFHSVSSFNNAGFDLFGDDGKFSGLTRYVDDPVVVLTIGSLVLLGGIGFIVIQELISYKKGKKLSLHTKIVLIMSLMLIIGGMVMILLIEWFNPKTLGALSWDGRLLSAWFQSICRTSGLNTLDLGSLYPTTLFMMILLMFVGASPSSTGGGIKTTTLAVILLAVWNMLRGRHDDIVAFKRRIPHYLVYKALTVSVAALIYVIIVTMILTISERTDLLTAMFETVSAFATVGWSMGLTPDLSALGKVIMIISMFVGKLGPVTLTLALAKSRTHLPYKYPEEKPLIG